MNTEPTPAQVLIVEDELLVGLALKRDIEIAGFLVLGPAMSVGNAMGLLQRCHVDAALLDINLGSETVYPVAHVLRDQRVPFAFVSARRRDDIDAAFRAEPLFEKPYKPDALVEWLVRAVPSVQSAATIRVSGGLLP